MNMHKLLLPGMAAAAASMLVSPAQAQQRYMGSIIPYANTSCPANTVDAAGQLLPIAQNSALFSLLGTFYGGDGTTTFALPDLRGRSPLGINQRPEQLGYYQGETGGAEGVVLTMDLMPTHTHSAITVGTTSAPNEDHPANAAFADFPSTQPVYNNDTPPAVNMATGTIAVRPTGSSSPAPIALRSPYLTIRYCVVTQGPYPSRP